MAQQTPALKLFDLLVSRDFDPEMLDSKGLPADPEDAEIFSIDFRAESGKDYGTVVIMLNDEGELQVYCTDNVGRSMEGQDKTDWFQFLEQLKNFSTRNFLSFGIKNLNRLRYSMQGQAAIKEGLFESWTGNRNTSWMGEATQARLMIRHHKNIGEGEARHRYVESLFIETAEGERYKLPFKKLSGGRAMLEHVKSGGKPYDARGQHIVTMVEEINVLARFRRANAGQLFEGDAATLVEQTNAYYENLQSRLKSISTTRGYNTYFESWSPADITDEEVVIESLKSLFVKQTIDNRIESALPLLARIQQQGTDMKEANIFEAWAERLTEGTWQTPDTPEAKQQLIDLLSKELIVGADATNATEQLYNLLGDDELFDRLEALADQDANADCRDLVYERLQELAENDPDSKAVLQAIGADTTDDEEDGIGSLGSKDEFFKNNPDHPAPENPYRNKGITEDAVQSMRRAAGLLVEDRLMDSAGETMEHILDRFRHEVRNFEQGGDLDDDLYDALYDYYAHSGDMPYGVQKAREGDPREWVASNLESHLRGGGIIGGNPDEDYGLERESVGDYAEEYQDPLSGILKNAGVPAQERPAPQYDHSDMKVTDEGELGTAVGTGLGAMVGGLPGAVIGGIGGHMLTGDDDEEETDEGIIGTLGGAALGGAMGGPLGAAVGAVGGQELTKGGSGIIEDDKEDSGSGWLLPAAAGAAAGYTAAGGDVVGDISKLAGIGGSAPAAAAGDVAGAGANAMGDIASSILEKETTDEGALGTAVGTGLGAMVGGLPGAVIGGIAGHALTDDDDDKKQTKEGWKGQLAGGTAGTLAGAALGSAAGPVGTAIGGALGGTAGQMLGDKLGGPDKKEVDEGPIGSVLGNAIGKKLGTVAGVAGANAAKKVGVDVGKMALARAGRATGQALGQQLGDVAGTAIGDKIQGKLQGQYGHSGQLKEVSKDLSFLDRLKELSGLKK